MRAHEGQRKLILIVENGYVEVAEGVDRQSYLTKHLQQVQRATTDVRQPTRTGRSSWRELCRMPDSRWDDRPSTGYSGSSRECVSDETSGGGQPFSCSFCPRSSSRVPSSQPFSQPSSRRPSSWRPVWLSWRPLWRPVLAAGLAAIFTLAFFLAGAALGPPPDDLPLRAPPEARPPGSPPGASRSPSPSRAAQCRVALGHNRSAG